MKFLFLKFFIFLYFILFLHILITGKVYAFENFEKSSSNPLKINFLPGYNEVFQTHIFRQNNLFKGIFSIKSTNNKYSLAYGTSTDGQEWTIQKELLSLDKNLFAPRLFISNFGQNKIFFTKDDNPYKIYEINCDSEFNCQNNTNLVLERIVGDLSESNGVFSSFVYYDNNKYYLFFGAWGLDGFKIKLATSSDGLNWTRCLGNQPITPNADGSFLYKKEGAYYLFFHASNSTGIEFMQSLQELSCDMQWETPQYVVTPTQNYDQRHLVAPSILELPGKLLLYYTGLGNDGIWRLNLATSQLPQPTPTPKIPLVLIPGFMSSWNKEAILHNQPTSIFDWKLAPYVREYDGIINTMKNLGYTENQDFLLFPYDWRKKLDDDADDFNSFLQQKIWNSTPEAKVNILGHSLGGLVSRIWLQKYNQDKINKLITVASPHKGAAQVYKAVESGELDRWSNFLWLTEKTILTINKNSFETDAQTINKLLPVLKDLLPTYDFLKKQNNKYLSINNMQIKNDTLLSYNPNLPNLPNIFSTFAGDRGDTLFGYNLGERTVLDQLLNLYVDGRPLSNLYDRGDLIVLSQSAGVGNNIKTLPLNHGEVIYKKDAIKEILNTLAIPYQENQISEGHATNLSPSILFLIKSPAQMKVLFNGNVYNEQDGLIFIENAQTGNYELKVTGTDNGSYQVIVGQITTNGDSWNTIDGQTTASQTSTYSVSFDQDKPLEFFIDEGNSEKLRNDILAAINTLNQPPNDNLTAAIKKLSRDKKPEDLLKVHKHLFNAIKELDSIKWNAILDVISKVEHLYDITPSETKQKPEKLAKESEQYSKQQANLEKILQKKKSEGTDVTQNALFFKLAQEKLAKANLALQQQNYNLSEILLKSVRELIALSKSQL